MMRREGGAAIIGGGLGCLLLKPSCELVPGEGEGGNDGGRTTGRKQAS